MVWVVIPRRVNGEDLEPGRRAGVEAHDLERQGLRQNSWTMLEAFADEADVVRVPVDITAETEVPIHADIVTTFETDPSSFRSNLGHRLTSDGTLDKPRQYELTLLLRASYPVARKMIIVDIEPTTQTTVLP